MRPTVTIPIVLVLCMIVSISAPILSETGSGEAIPDYDIDVDTTIAHIRHENGNTGTFKITIINQCAHTLTIQVNVSGAGVHVSPMTSTVTVGAGSSTDINVLVALLYFDPAGVYGVNIHTEVIRVDGTPTSNGRERHASVVVLAHRHHCVSVENEDITAVKGEATSGSILINNSGNAPDWFALKFQNTEEVNAYPAVDYTMVPPGEVVEYPIIVSVSKKASTGPTSLDYRVHSIIDEDAQANGTLLVKVVKEETEENELCSPIAGLLVAVGIMLLIVPMFYFQDFLNRRGLKKPSLLFSFLVSFLMLSSALLIIVSPEGGAQEVSLEVSPASPLDPSPFTEDEAATGTMMVTIKSNSTPEYVVRATIDAPGAIIGYVMEHRIPPNGEKTFPVSIGIEKGSPYCVSMGNIHVEVIEVQGVAVEDGYTVDIGFPVVYSPYSLPQIVPWDGSLIPEDKNLSSVMGIKKDRATSMVFTIVNHGNAFDEFNFTIENKAELEEKGFEFSNITQRNGTIPVFHVFNFTMTPTKKLSQEFYVLRALAQGVTRDEPVGGCTVVLVREESDDDDDDEIPLAMAGAAGGIGILVVIGVFIFTRKKKADDIKGDDETSHGGETKKEPEKRG
ncbi:MAG: hypothetical protein KAU14_02105 [Thermoplasmata archaeon]|nr:hypothetical protein [Thermoplasmata archaeon]